MPRRVILWVAVLVVLGWCAVPILAFGPGEALMVALFPEDGETEEFAASMHAGRKSHPDRTTSEAIYWAMETGFYLAVNPDAFEIVELADGDWAVVATFNYPIWHDWQMRWGATYTVDSAGTGQWNQARAIPALPPGLALVVLIPGCCVVSFRLLVLLVRRRQGLTAICASRQSPLEPDAGCGDTGHPI